MCNFRDSCKNGRGKVNGLSQETYCSQCIRSDTWKSDHYDPKNKEFHEKTLQELADQAQKFDTGY